MTNDITDPFAGLATATQAPAPAAPPITPPQERYINNLCAERPMFMDVMNYWPDNVAKFTKRQASAVIEELLATPKEARSAPAATAALTEGIYRKSGRFYRVYLTRTSRQQVAAVLHVLRDAVRDAAGNIVESGAAEWDYLGKAGLKQLALSDKCTQEEAASFGALYGICCNCLAELNHPISIHCGYGPVCASKNGWWRPTDTEYAAILTAAGVDLA